MPEFLGYQFDRLFSAPIERYRQVSTIAERDAIPTGKRWEGMLCYVTSESQDYQLSGGTSNLDWINAGAGDFFDKGSDTTDDITEGITNLFLSPTDQTKLDYITVTTNINLDTLRTDVDALGGGVIFIDEWDASSGTFPGGGTAAIGHLYIVSVAGTVDGVSFSVGDGIIAKTTNASTTTFAGNWIKTESNSDVTSVVGLTGVITKTELLSALNVEDGATADMTGEEISNAITSYLTTADWQTKLSKESVLDFVSESFADGSHQGVNIQYDDANNLFNFIVNEFFGISYGTLATLLSDQGSQNTSSLYEITDASGFTTITSGRAWVRYRGTAVGDETDYIIVSKEEGGGSFTSPLTTKGDILSYTTEDVRIPVGSDGQVLVADSAEAAGVKWDNNTGAALTDKLTVLATLGQTGTTLSPIPNSIDLYKNGQWLIEDTDYTYNNTTGVITWDASLADDYYEIRPYNSIVSVDLSDYQLKPIEGAFVDGDKTKLDGIEEGAEVNIAPIPITYADLTALLADQGNQILNYIYEVTDGSGFDGVNNTSIWVKYLGTTLGTTEDYKIQSRATVSRNDIFYVEDYGAIADGDGTTGVGTDNTTFIQNALAAVVANGGGVLQFGKGVYRYAVTKIDIATDNITIKGLGMGITTLFWDDAVTNDQAIRINANYCVVEDLSMQMRYTFLSAGSAVIVQTGDYNRFENVEVYDSNCFSLQMNGNGGIVRGCYLHDSAADGIHVQKGSNMLVEGNTIINCADDGIGVGFGGATSNVVVTNNYIYNVGVGVSIWGYSTVAGVPQVNDIIVTNNTISDTWMAGVACSTRAGSVVRITISENNIFNAGIWIPDASVPMRSYGTAAGIVLEVDSEVSGQKLQDVQILGNVIVTPRNSFINIGYVVQRFSQWGSFGSITVKNNHMNGIVTSGGATSGNGQPSYDPTQYAGIELKTHNVVNGTAIDISNNYMRSVRKEYFRQEVSTASGYVSFINNYGILGNATGSSVYAFYQGDATTKFNFEGNISENPQVAFTGYSSIADTSAINTTAGDSATINSLTGRFRKDVTGTTFTLTNSYITTNSKIFIQILTTGLTTGYNAVAVAGLGSATITFQTGGTAAAPSANADVNFWIIN